MKKKFPNHGKKDYEWLNCANETSGIKYLQSVCKIHSIPDAQILMSIAASENQIRNDMRSKTHREATTAT